jgi:hypothetical protein
MPMLRQPCSAGTTKSSGCCEKLIFLWEIQLIFESPGVILVPSSTAGKIVLKLSSTKIISAASLATSVPLLPIEIPMSAIFNAGASFTASTGHEKRRVVKNPDSPPSPVMATTAPLLWNASTMAILCLGVVLANTLTVPTLSFSWAVVI